MPSAIVAPHSGQKRRPRQLPRLSGNTRDWRRRRVVPTATGAATPGGVIGVTLRPTYRAEFGGASVTVTSLTNLGDDFNQFRPTVSVPNEMVAERNRDIDSRRRRDLITGEARARAPGPQTDRSRAEVS